MAMGTRKQREKQKDIWIAHAELASAPGHPFRNARLQKARRCCVPQQSPISFQVRTKNVLIVDGNEAMQKLRARVLRSRGVHVHTAKSITEAASLWVPDFFDLILLDVRQRSKEAVEFWRTIRRQHPSQRIRFLVGPPTYLSPTCADEVIDRDRVPEDYLQARNPPCRIRPYKPIAARWRQSFKEKIL